jgi:hypothetical protein
MHLKQHNEGLLLQLYHQLWKKHEGQSCLINIPNTVRHAVLCVLHVAATGTHPRPPLLGALQVLYQNSLPVAWYFTGVKEGRVSAS